MDDSPPNRKPKTTAATTFLDVAKFIVPLLTPPELATISCTCGTLSHLSHITTAARSSDASRSFEPHPIPFINTIDSHPYAYFLYTPTQLTSPPPARQFWGVQSIPNTNPNPQFNFGDLEGAGCDCSPVCDDDCSCSSLRFSDGAEVVIECGESCRCESSCVNRVTQKSVSVKLKIVRVLNKGWGLFADEFIPSGQFVCEYAGELLTTREARRRQQLYDQLSRRSEFCSALLVVREHLPSRKACFRINIDATMTGNVARFINHSCDGGNLSTVLVRSFRALLPRVCVFTSRDIQSGEELSFSYGEVRPRPEGLHCCCGSRTCYGILPSENT